MSPIFDDLDAMVDCPTCSAEQAWEECLLGELGDLIHFRCRYCGSQWSEGTQQDSSES